jgi:hypothetical protein
MNVRAALLLALALVFTASSSAQEPAGLGDETAAAADDDPRIDPEEIVADPIEADDGWGGDPGPWYEDPASVDCGDRRACWEALGEKEGEPCTDEESCRQVIGSESTTSTGAPR